MNIWNYNKEKKEKGHQEVYLKFGLFGLLIALFFIGGFKLLAFLLDLIIRKWVWVLVFVAAAFMIKYFVSRRKPAK